MGCHVCGENHGTRHYFEVCLPTHQATHPETPKGRLQRQIADLETDEECGLTDEHDRLIALRRELYELELAEKRPTEISMERLDLYESEKKSIECLLSQLGKEIVKVRGDDLSAGNFHAYDRVIADEWAIRDYPKGTRLIEITYRINQRYEPDYRTVLFPESYLDNDWREIEQAKIEAELAAKAAESEIAKVAAMAQREVQERAELARLQAKYGETK